jgi:hypothetical protein
MVAVGARLAVGSSRLHEHAPPPQPVQGEATVKSTMMPQTMKEKQHD